MQHGVTQCTSDVLLSLASSFPDEPYAARRYTLHGDGGTYLPFGIAIRESCVPKQQ